MAALVKASGAEPRGAVHDYVQVLRRRGLEAVIVAAVVFGLVALLTLRQKPVYQATSTLLLQPRPGAALALPSAVAALGVQAGFTETLVQIVSTQAVAERVARRLNGGQDPPPSLVRSVEGTIAAVPVRGADVVRINAQHRDPAMAARLAEAGSQAIIELTTELQRREATTARQFLEAQLTQIRRDLERTEVLQMQSRLGRRGVAVSDELATKLKLVSDLDARKISTQIERREAQMRLEYVKGELKRQFNVAPSEFTQPDIKLLRDRVAVLEIELLELLQQYTDRHPLVQAQRKKVEGARAVLRQALEASFGATVPSVGPVYLDLLRNAAQAQVDLFSIDARERYLDTLIARHEAELKGMLPEDLTQVRVLRNLRTLEQVYTFLAQRIYEARISEASVVPPLRIMDSARVPDRPIRPNKRLNLMLGLVIAIVLGVATTVGLESLDRRIHAADEAERVLGLPVMGVIPALPSGRNGEALHVAAASLLARDRRRSAFAEAFRSLRTALLYANPGAPPRVVLVTSALPLEGKTTVAGNLAVTLAQFGKRVWLVEADLRRPRLREALEPQGAQGLTDYLVGAASLEQVVQRTDTEGLWFVPSGTIPPSPADLLGSQRMQDFLDAARAQADFVVLDSAPCLPVADTVTLAPHTDGAVLVVRAGYSRRDAVVRAKRLLDGVGARTIGTVMIAVSPPGQAAYGYSYDQDQESVSEGARSSRHTRDRLASAARQLLQWGRRG